MILLTTFATWKPTQPSNSADDLVAELLQRGLLSDRVHTLRQIPVDFQQAPELVISKLEVLQPRVVICCGMASRRKRLSIEVNGKGEGEVRQTAIDVPALVRQLTNTRVSQNAGKFVCNHLYYSVLKHIEAHAIATQCIFVHVPLLNEKNLESIVEDFSLILKLV